MNLRIVENNINVNEYKKIFKKVNWNCYDDNSSMKAIKSSIYIVSVYDDDEIVGMGRIIGDVACFLYFHDVIVATDYQNKKIGTMIVNKLLDKVDEIKKEYPLVRVYLGSSIGKEPFYRKFGFISRKDANLGDGMILLERK